MSVLINRGIGEISDRLSILALKLLHVKAEVETKHWRTEQTALLTQLRGREVNGKWFEAYTELAAVNAALWYAEDALRLQRHLPVGQQDETGIVTTAFWIQELNDRRAVLVEEINKAVGDYTGPEKGAR